MLNHKLSSLIFLSKLIFIYFNNFHYTANHFLVPCAYLHTNFHKNSRSTAFSDTSRSSTIHSLLIFIYHMDVMNKKKPISCSFSHHANSRYTYESAIDTHQSHLSEPPISFHLPRYHHLIVHCQPTLQSQIKN